MYLQNPMMYLDCRTITSNQCKTKTNLVIICDYMCNPDFRSLVQPHVPAEPHDVPGLDFTDLKSVWFSLPRNLSGFHCPEICLVFTAQKSVWFSLPRNLSGFHCPEICLVFTDQKSVWFSLTSLVTADNHISIGFGQI